MGIAPAAIEFGIYRDGDNNLDHEEAHVINQELNVSSRDSSIEVVVEDRLLGEAFSTKARFERRAPDSRRISNRRVRPDTARFVEP